MLCMIQRENLAACGNEATKALPGSHTMVCPHHYEELTALVKAAKGKPKRARAKRARAHGR